MTPTRRCIAHAAPALPPPGWVDGEPSLREITDDIARPLDGAPGPRLVDLLRRRARGAARPGAAW